MAKGVFSLSAEETEAQEEKDLPKSELRCAQPGLEPSQALPLSTAPLSPRELADQDSRHWLSSCLHQPPSFLLLSRPHHGFSVFFL